MEWHSNYAMLFDFSYSFWSFRIAGKILFLQAVVARAHATQQQRYRTQIYIYIHWERFVSKYLCIIYFRGFRPLKIT